MTYNMIQDMDMRYGHTELRSYGTTELQVREEQGCRHTLGILFEYAWSMARVWLEAGKSMARVWIEPRIAISMLLLMVVGVGSAWGQDTDYSGVYYIANAIWNGDHESGKSGYEDYWYDVNKPNTNWYLVPGDNPQRNNKEDAWYSPNYTTQNGDLERPFLTTYRTNRDNNSVWIVKKTGNLYYIIHALTGKYVKYEPPYVNGVSGQTNNNNCHRKAIHLETWTDPDNDPGDVFKFEITEKTRSNPSFTGFNIKYPGTLVAGSHRYFNPSGDNWEYYYGKNNKSPYSLGMVGLWTEEATLVKGGLWPHEDAKAALTPTISDINTTNNTFTITCDFVPTDYSIVYTTDGSDPSINTSTTPATINGTEYSGPVTVTESITVKAAVIGYDMVLSNIDSKSLSPFIAAPTVTNNYDGTISLSTSTAGTTIYYTTNGDTPDNTSTEYSSAFSLGDATVIKAIAYLGSESSDVTIYNVPKYDAPTISFNSATSQVTITSEGTAYYNTGDGSQADPTTSSTEYNAPFTVSSATTVKAIATHAGYLPSSVAELVISQVVKPTIQNNGSITTTTPDATIYYTTNGTTPSRSNYQNSPISVTDGDVVKAIAVKEGLIDSEVETHVVGDLAAPTITYTYDNSDHFFTISYDPAILAKDDVHILYTTDGSDPTIGGSTTQTYNSKVKISKNYTVKAVVVRYGEILSEVASEQVVAACFEPTFTYDPSTEKVTIETETENATIYYTINGENPDPTGLEEEKYTEPITIKKGDVVKAIAMKDGLNNSEVVTYTFMLPVISYDYTTGKVSITINMDGASIYYTTNGNDPTSASTPYTEPFAITNGTVVKAIAIKGTDESEIAVFTLTIPTITYNPATKQVEITGGPDGATYYYTINGGVPSAANNEYSQPFFVMDGEVIKAIAVKDGSSSSVAILTITLTPTINLGTTSYIYDGTAKEPVVTSVTLGEATIPSSEYTVSYSNNTAAGTATVTISNTPGGIYYVSGTKTFPINKKEVGLDWDTTPIIYNGTAQAPTATATGLISGDVCTVTVTVDGEHKNANSYTAKATALSNPNYTLPTTTTQSFTINPRVAELDWQDLVQPYSGQALSPTVSVLNRIQGDLFHIELTVSDGHTDAGNYTATVTALGNTNYALPSDPTATFTITKANPHPTVNITGWAYSGYNAEVNTPTVSNLPDDFPDSYTVNYTYSVKDENGYSASVPTDAGNYTVKATLAATDNYAEAEATADFTIEKIDRSNPAVTIADWTYDSAPSTPSVTGNTEEGSVTYKYKEEGGFNFTNDIPTDVGNHTIQATIATTKNYKESVVTKNFHINKADINPSLVISDWEYNNPGTITVNGNTENGEVSFEYKVKGANDNTYVTFKPTNVGDYTVKASIDDTKNYNGAVITEDFSIARAEITPTVTIDGWTFGDTPNHPYVSGNLGGGVITYEYKLTSADDNAYTSTVPSAAGDYTIRATIAQSDNYKSATATADFTIEKAVLSPYPVLNLADWTYGGTASTPTITNNLGDDNNVEYQYKEVHTAEPTITTSSPAVEGKVTVTINTDLAGATIYYTTNGDKPTRASLVYDDEPFEIAEEDQANVKAIAIKDGDYSSTKPTNAGSYMIMATIHDTDNYYGATIENSFNILKATLTISPSVYTKVYGEVDPSIDIIVSGLASTDVFSGSLERESGGNVGNYALSLQEGWTIKSGDNDKSANYNEAIIQPAYFTITPKSIGDGITPAEGFTLTVSQTDNVWSATLKQGETPLELNTDYEFSTYGRSIDGESYINSDEVDVVFDITGKGNYTGEVKGAKSAPRFCKYEIDTENNKDYYISVYRNGATDDWLKPDGGPTAYMITDINPARQELMVTPLAYYPTGVPIVLLTEKTHGDSAPNGYEVEGMKGNDGEPTRITSGEKSRNLLKVSEGVLSDPTDPASTKVPEHVNAAQVYIYDKDKGEFVLALEGNLPIGTFYIDNPNYPPTGSGAGAPPRLRIVRADSTPVRSIERDNDSNDDSWYTIDGRRLNIEPQERGIYLHNGKKVMVR